MTVSGLFAARVFDMNRREFVIQATALASAAWGPSLLALGEKPEVAFTFDDPTLDGGAGLRWQDVNERILHSLERRRVQAALFVCGKRVHHPEGRELIGQWDQARPCGRQPLLFSSLLQCERCFRPFGAREPCGVRGRCPEERAAHCQIRSLRASVSLPLL